MRAILILVAAGSLLVGCDSDDAKFRANCAAAGFTLPQCNLLLAMKNDSDSANDAATASLVASGIAAGASSR